MQSICEEVGDHLVVNRVAAKLDSVPLELRARQLREHALAAERDEQLRRIPAEQRENFPPHFGQVVLGRALRVVSPL